eukprot:5334972-Alexandrium_andersonii.AAC.1
MVMCALVAEFGPKSPPPKTLRDIVQATDEKAGRTLSDRMGATPQARKLWVRIEADKLHMIYSYIVNCYRRSPMSSKCFRFQAIKNIMREKDRSGNLKFRFAV